MKASLTCSNCGAAIEGMNLNWGKKQFLLLIPFMLLAMLPMMRLFLFKPDVQKDLSVSQIEKRVDGSTVSVLGVITNQGNREWSSVTVEVEFYDDEGKFVDEYSDYLRSDIPPNGKEHFKIELRGATELSEKYEMKVKVAGAHSMPF